MKIFFWFDAFNAPNLILAKKIETSMFLLDPVCRSGARSVQVVFLCQVFRFSVQCSVCVCSCVCGCVWLLGLLSGLSKSKSIESFKIVVIYHHTIVFKSKTFKAKNILTLQMIVITHEIFIQIKMIFFIQFVDEIKMTHHLFITSPQTIFYPVGNVFLVSVCLAKCALLIEFSNFMHFFQLCAKISPENPQKILQNQVFPIFKSGFCFVLFY